MGARSNRLIETVLTSTHNLCFRAKIRKQCKPQFYYMKVWCNWGLTLHGHVSVMGQCDDGLAAMGDIHTFIRVI